MADVDAPMALAAEFAPADRDDWLALAGDVERLRTTTYDGITIEPLYTSADAATDTGLPGFPPFVRGRTAAGTRSGWDVRQVVDGGVPGRVVEELERGATSIWLELRHIDRIDVDAALDGVVLDVAPVVLASGTRWPRAAEVLAARWERFGLVPAAGGSLGADPFGEWAWAPSSIDLDAELAAAATWAVRLATEAPGVRTVTVDGTRYHERGASDGQELGITVAAAVESLRALDALDNPFAALELRLAATVDQFATIAKFRAARRLWARVAEVSGVPAAAAGTPLHAVTSSAMMTRYDPAVNMLRATVACFAAGVAGADAVTVLPFDAFSAGVPSELGRRLARNTQSVLAMESNLTRVTDPAGGSWYVEQLTEQLTERAWSVFRDIEAAGGFRAAVEVGIVDDRIAATRAARTADIDHRRAPIIGVTEFPSSDVAGPPVEDLATDTAYRWAAGFESLRATVDAAAASGKRPAVFLARLGSSAATAQTSTAAANFFGIAGIDAPRGPVSADIEEVVEAFADSGTTVACICTATDVDDARRDELRAALRGAGATRVFSANDIGGDARAALADLLDHVSVS